MCVHENLLIISGTNFLMDKRFNISYYFLKGKHHGQQKQFYKSTIENSKVLSTNQNGYLWS